MEFTEILKYADGFLSIVLCFFFLNYYMKRNNALHEEKEKLMLQYLEFVKETTKAYEGIINTLEKSIEKTVEAPVKVKQELAPMIERVKNELINTINGRGK